MASPAGKAIALLVLCACACKRDAPRAAPVATDGPPAVPETRVSEPYFRMKLPGTWIRSVDQEAQLWTFVRTQGKEQLSVSLIFAPRPMPPNLQSQMLEGLLVRRRAEERKRAKSPVTYSDVVRTQLDGMLAARYDSEQPERHRRATFLLMVRSAIVATFHYETEDVSSADFLAHARTIFNSIDLADPVPRDGGAPADAR